MAALFFDSSALIKRYIAETGTAWVIGLLRPAANHDIFVANITGIESASAIALRVRGKSISTTKAAKAINRLKRDFENRFIVVDLTATIIEKGILLAEHSACAVTTRLN